MFLIYNFNITILRGESDGIILPNPIKFVVCSMNNAILVPRKWPIYSGSGQC